MPKHNVISVFLFVVFFSIGALAFGISIISDELLQHYQNKEVLRRLEQSQRRLKSLISDYEAVINRTRNDPNLIERIMPTTLGIEPAGPNTAYPKPTRQLQAAVRQALAEEANKPSIESAVPEWLRRCNQPWRRITLFVAGAFLILISFICFNADTQIRTKDR